MDRLYMTDITKNGRFWVVLKQAKCYNKKFGDNLAIVPTPIKDSGEVWGADLPLAAWLVHQA